MPNHVKNIVKMEGITKLPLFKTEYDEYEKKDVTCFDFNKIIPMPESLNMDSGSMESLAIEAVNRKLGQRRYTRSTSSAGEKASVCIRMKMNSGNAVIVVPATGAIRR